ncbi:MAG: DMT family transporter [Leptospiraceae bacterium]|nr:DMT family transporter [Leptospiraceae bacterium]MDW8307637.1 DMT family transporter [Leptospiraceae bacterium]
MASLGSLAILFSAFAFYFSTYFVYLGQKKYPISAFVFVFWRFLVGFLVFELFVLFQRHDLPPIQNKKGLYVRSFWNTIAVYFFLWGVEVSGVTKGNILNMTYPAFVALLAPLYVKEKIALRHLLAVLLTISGSFFVIGEGRVLYFSAKDFIGLISGLTAGIAVLSLRDIRQSDSTYQIIRTQFRFGFLFSLVVLVFLGFRQQIFEHVLLPYLFWSGFLGFLGQLLLTYGFRYVSSVQGSVLSSTRIVIAFIFGLILEHRDLPWISHLGAILILCANLLLAMYNKKQESPAAARQGHPSSRSRGQTRRDGVSG